MQDSPSIEELVIDDTFVNYCFRNNEEDYAYWTKYLHRYPSEREKVNEAKYIVLSLRLVIKQKRDERSTQVIDMRPRYKHYKKIIGYAMVVAAVSLAVMFISRYLSFTLADVRSDQRMITVAPSSKTLLYQTKHGEKKVVVLSDSTKIWLNADTKLIISEDYGKRYRKVTLSGEALFDVIHNEQSPFIVYTDRSEITDLGTVFNVRDYPGDKESETSLIAGQVQIKVIGEERTFMLVPNEKLVVSRNVAKEKSGDNEGVLMDAHDVALRPLSYSQSDSALLETAWVQNRLEFNNEDFYQMKERLERWFDVRITIQDDEAGKYPFTATFRKENIREVLQALQYAYHFNYKINDHDITISK